MISGLNVKGIKPLLQVLKFSPNIRHTFDSKKTAGRKQKKKTLRVDCENTHTNIYPNILTYNCSYDALVG